MVMTGDADDADTLFNVLYEATPCNQSIADML